MQLAILMTNTDESDFARAHPKDGEKFTTMIRSVRPGWGTTVFAVKDGAFPRAMAGFDGAIITGSPASVNGSAPWIARLLGLIRQMHAARLPVFGACFGHQAIAVALGGVVGPNPGGWVHGRIRNRILFRTGWMGALPDPLHLYGSHREQVAVPPEKAVPLMQSEGCDVAGMAIGRHIYTTQHHPEMTPAFIAALTGEMAADLGPEITRRARASLRAGPADAAPFAESIARFFEQGRR